MTTPLSGSLPTTPTAVLSRPTGATTSPATKANDELDKDAFLQLLVAQLKYQDPTKPVDSAAFMAQTAQFTVVEKLDALSRTHAELLSSNRALSASALIGRQVVHAGGDGTDVTATVTGVRFDLSGPVLLTAGTEVPLAGVKEVRPAGTTV